MIEERELFWAKKNTMENYQTTLFQAYSCNVRTKLLGRVHTGSILFLNYSLGQIKWQVAVYYFLIKYELLSISPR